MYLKKALSSNLRNQNKNFHIITQIVSKTKKANFEELMNKYVAELKQTLA